VSPELRERLASLSEVQRELLASTIEQLPDQGSDLLETDIHILIDELIAPTAMELIECMTASERLRCQQLSRQLGVDTISTDQLAQVVPWLADHAEIMRRVERKRAEPPPVYDPDGW
jgi:hypothetical protein